MSDSDEKQCRRCGDLFRCRHEAVEQCGCAAVVLTQALRELLALRYGDCLCPACLRAIAKEHA